MQKYSTTIGMIELRQSGVGYRTTKKRYNLGNSTVTLIMNRFHELGISLVELKAIPPKKPEETFYPSENLRRVEKKLLEFFQIHQRMMAMETPDLAFQWVELQVLSGTFYQPFLSQIQQNKRPPEQTILTDFPTPSSILCGLML